MTMKLFVDDIRNPPDDTWMLARTVTSAIHALSMFEFDEISLDHDISHQVVVGALSRPYPCDETFQPVAHYIALKYNLSRLPGSSIVPLVTLHTSNPVGASEMEQILLPHVNVQHKHFGAANRLEMEV